MRCLSFWHCKPRIWWINKDAKTVPSTNKRNYWLAALTFKQVSHPAWIPYKMCAPRSVSWYNSCRCDRLFHKLLQSIFSGPFVLVLCAINNWTHTNHQSLQQTCKKNTWEMFQPSCGLMCPRLACHQSDLPKCPTLGSSWSMMRKLSGISFSTVISFGCPQAQRGTLWNCGIWQLPKLESTLLGFCWVQLGVGVHFEVPCSCFRGTSYSLKSSQKLCRILLDTSNIIQYHCPFTIPCVAF